MKFQDLLAYRKSFDLAMRIFEVSKSFPKEEVYSLTDQVRRCSRSVSANIAEAYGKRPYQKHFISKLSDSDAENLELQSWLAFALSCKYLEKHIFDELMEESHQVGKLINYMMANPQKFGSKQN
ncbi:four helix bundle protein [Arenibacter certesii]|uniref:Four helix bundle protein n=1 Tax=Arenibacter certesii TaxID=228955 RepID=A0A918IWE2_9FLAO|nr:four helix bundle protein [Arenibacter certesii]GGW35386.1 four helix bundle protein [Arenibacter certesii]